MIEVFRQHLIEHKVLDMYCEAILNSNLSILSNTVSVTNLFTNTFGFSRTNVYFKINTDWTDISRLWSVKVFRNPKCDPYARIAFSKKDRELFVEQLKGGSKTRKLLRHVMR